MQFSHDLEALKEALARQNSQLSHLTDALAEFDSRLPLDPGVLRAIDEALEAVPTPPARGALPLTGRRG